MMSSYQISAQTIVVEHVHVADCISHKVPCGRISIHNSWGTDSCKGVGASEGGGSAGAGKSGPIRRHGDGFCFCGIRVVRDRMDMLVRVARKTLYCARGIRWSLERRNIIVPFAESGLKDEVACNGPMNEGSASVWYGTSGCGGGLEYLVGKSGFVSLCFRLAEAR